MARTQEPMSASSGNSTTILSATSR
uniref:p2C35 n=1 Tax=Arundo donax TaxID=35708 RepID=A0A0A9DGC5_ARUDO